jgi:hypothetical protein
MVLVWVWYPPGPGGRLPSSQIEPSSEERKTCIVIIRCTQTFWSPCTIHIYTYIHTHTHTTTRCHVTEDNNLKNTNVRIRNLKMKNVVYRTVRCWGSPPHIMLRLTLWKAENQCIIGWSSLPPVRLSPWVISQISRCIDSIDFHPSVLTHQVSRAEVSVFLFWIC